MEDSELTRKAVEELMKDMNARKQTENLPIERKKNPLGKPNKIFLGRTINSMLTYNKRQSDIRLEKREHRVKKLETKRRKRDLKTHQRIRHEKSDCSPEMVTTNSCDNMHSREINTKLKKKKKKKRQRSPSSSSTRSSTDSSDWNLSPRKKYLNHKKKKHKRLEVYEEPREEICTKYVDDTSMNYHVDPNMAYAVMAYSQINQIIQQQQIVQQQVVKEPEEKIEIPSDLSISCHSSPESSLNISFNSSSAEEDENGILTFKLSSEDENGSKMSTIKNEIPPTISEEIDKESICSHISLDSEESKESIIKEINEIYMLSSSCSDSEDLQIVETVPQN